MVEQMKMVGLLLLMIVVMIIFYAPVIYIIVLLIKALRRYLKSSDVRKEKNKTRKSLGESLKIHRTNCKMTQEFVADSLGVSRQAVSKWENGVSQTKRY